MSRNDTFSKIADILKTLREEEETLPETIRAEAEKIEKIKNEIIVINSYPSTLQPSSRSPYVTSGAKNVKIMLQEEKATATMQRYLDALNDRLQIVYLIKAGILKLPHRYRQVLSVLYLGEKKRTYEEAAEYIGIDTAYLGRLRAEAITRLAGILKW